jgi:hypothetical protein
LVARRFAARIGVVREAAGIVAYRAGHFSEALSDLRAARRMTGSDAYLPVMADCERGMGRPERAIDLVRSPEAERLDRAGRIELTIVESGARRDLGQHDAAVITLQRLPELRDPQPKPWSARLAFAYADALADAGHQDAATDWFGRAMAFDEDGETDAAERYAELTGAVIEDVEEDFDYEDDSDDADVAEAEVGDVATVDEEADDAAVLAEAGDLLDTEIAADDVEESSEEAEFGDEPDEGEHASASGASEADSTEGEGDDDSDVVTLPEEAAEAGETASAGKAEETAVETVETAETAEAGEQAAGVPGITPAFIEPNFGDVLDEGAESPADKAKKDED